MKIVEVHLPYFKQGYDLGHYLEDSTNEEALEADAAMLKLASEMLLKIKDIIKGNENVKIDADTHMIIISGDDGIMNKLIEENLAEENDWGDGENKEEKDKNIS